MDTLRRFPDINGPFRGSHALADGWLTSDQLRSSLLRRMFRDVYVPRATEPSHSTRCLGASLIAPPSAVLTGCSAATVLGLELAGPTDPVEFVVPEHARFLAQRGIDVRRTTVTDAECRPWGRIRIATPLRLAFDVLINTSGLIHKSGYSWCAPGPDRAPHLESSVASHPPGGPRRLTDE